MGRMSRNKGKVGEREAAKAWVAAFGGEASRGVQYQGGPESPDIVTNCYRLHIEVKRQETGNVYAYIEQAVEDAKGKIPVVLHRRNKKPWLLVLRLDDAPAFMEAVRYADFERPN